MSSHFLVIFSYQGRFLNLPKNSHTFATFIRLNNNSEMEHHTISWLPRTRDVRMWNLKGQPGENVDLKTTLKLAKSLGSQLSMWGPFEVHETLFHKALRRIEQLNSGKIDYVVLDNGHRPHQATNCTHAISDLDDESRALRTHLARGAWAGYLVKEHFSRWFVSPEKTPTYPGLLEKLGVLSHEIEDRSAHRESLLTLAFPVPKVLRKG